MLGSFAALVFRSGGDFAPTLGETIAKAGDNSALIESARTAFVNGMHVAVVAGAVLLFVAALAKSGSGTETSPEALSKSGTAPH